MPKGYDDQFAEFKKPGKVTAQGIVADILCVKCGVAMYVLWHGRKVPHYSHPVEAGELSDPHCPNAGKRFKVATIQLDELE
jgi:hypothetical protein